MKAMLLERLSPIVGGAQPLSYTDVDEPVISEDEVLLRVHCAAGRGLAANRPTGPALPHEKRQQTCW